MTELKNKRHEAFAAALARGVNATKAYGDAGFSPHHQNASRLASNDAVKQRVLELQSQQKTNTTNSRNEQTGQFLQGFSGNPRGRPRGSRNLLGEQFLIDLQGEWQRSGVSALERVAKDDPVAFTKIVASTLPKELDATLSVNVSLFQEARDFAEAYRLARQYIGADDAKLIELEASAETEP